MTPNKHQNIEDYIIFYITNNQSFYKSMVDDNLAYKDEKMFFMSLSTFARYLKQQILSAFAENYTTGNEDTDNIIKHLFSDADYNTIANKLYGQFINICMLAYVKPSSENEILDIISAYLSSEDEFFNNENLNY